MSAVYVETSALLTWLLRQKGEETFARAVDAAELVVTSALTFAEAGRAVARLEADGKLDAVRAGALRSRLERMRDSWLVLAVDAAVLERAAGPFPVEPVRTLDAIHLASALLWARERPDLGVVSGDRRVAANAKALGLR